MSQSLSGYDNELVSLNVSIGEKILNNKFGIYIYTYTHLYNLVSYIIKTTR